MNLLQRTNKDYILYCKVATMPCYIFISDVQSSPRKDSDVLAYQIIILEASLEFEGNGWLGYNRRFHQNAAADPNVKWETTCTDNGLRLLVE